MLTRDPVRSCNECSFIVAWVGSQPVARGISIEELKFNSTYFIHVLYAQWNFVAARK